MRSTASRSHHQPDDPNDLKSGLAGVSKESARSPEELVALFQNPRERLAHALSDYLFTRTNLESCIGFRTRLDEEIADCLELREGLIPLGWVIASAAAARRDVLRGFSAALQRTLNGDIPGLLDDIGQSIRRIRDEEIQNASMIAVSVITVASLPVNLPGREKVFGALRDKLSANSILLAKHQTLFPELRRLRDRSLTLRTLPADLEEIAARLETIDSGSAAPPLLVTVSPKDARAVELLSKINQLRVRASSPPELKEEREALIDLPPKLGRPIEEILELTVKLYEADSMNGNRSRGITVGVILDLINRLNERLGHEVKEIRFSPHGSAPFQIDDTGVLTLSKPAQGGLTRKSVEDLVDKMVQDRQEQDAARQTETLLAKVRAEAEAREALEKQQALEAAEKARFIAEEAAALEKAAEPYQRARARLIGPLEDERTERGYVAELASVLGTSLAQTFEIVTELYSNSTIRFGRWSENPLSGQTISVKGLVNFCAELKSKAGITATGFAFANLGDKSKACEIQDSGVVRINLGCNKISDNRMRGDLEIFLKSRSAAAARTSPQPAVAAKIEVKEIQSVTLPLVSAPPEVISLQPKTATLLDPNEEYASYYRNRNEPGSFIDETNFEALMEEFDLYGGDLQADCLSILVESLPQIAELSVDAVRSVLTTLNARVPAKIKLILDGNFTSPTDPTILAAVVNFQEGEEFIPALCFNTFYGEKAEMNNGSAMPPVLSDEVLLNWCRSYVPPDPLRTL